MTLILNDPQNINCVEEAREVYNNILNAQQEGYLFVEEHVNGAHYKTYSILTALKIFTPYEN